MPSSQTSPSATAPIDETGFISLVSLSLTSSFEETNEERIKRIGFQYMGFTNIPRSVRDFKEKEKKW
jgi:hypothetical protein